MNKQLEEVNELIALSTKMIDVAKTNGKMSSDNRLYQEYKPKVNSFCNKIEIKNNRYFPYYTLDHYFQRNYTFYAYDLEEIRRALISIKHDKFSQYFEKIFISHKEAEKNQIDELIELLHVIGIPRPTVNSPESTIFCTSSPEGCIGNRKPNLEQIRNMINTEEHVFYVLWYTDEYYKSASCMNEAGAIWIMKKEYQEILVPGFDSSKICGILDKQPVWFRANDKARLNEFKDQITEMFCLQPLTENAWEPARDKFISRINDLAERESKIKEESST